MPGGEFKTLVETSLNHRKSLFWDTVTKITFKKAKKHYKHKQDKNIKMRKPSAEWESLISLKENGLRTSLRRKKDFERSKLSCSRNQIILISIFYLNLSMTFYYDI